MFDHTQVDDNTERTIAMKYFLSGLGIGVAMGAFSYVFFHGDAVLFYLLVSLCRS